MIYRDLYQKILIDPASMGNDELFIVSGYASATFLRRHLEDIKEISSNIIINLLIGMPHKKNDHRAYLNIKDSYPNSFNGSYYIGTPGVHSKAYVWAKNNTPQIGFTGSANYSQYGFFHNMQENQMNNDDPLEIKNYFDSLISRSIKIDDYVLTNNDSIETVNLETSIPQGEIQWMQNKKIVIISWLDKQGRLPMKSGINWGQRPGREPNQAYLPLRSDSRDEGFLPTRALRFTLLTDDNKVFDCVVAQEGRKAIQTTNDNSELGKYLRNRLNVEEGKLVSKQDLMTYGRTDFLLKKLDDETFFLDFSSQK